MTANTRYGLVGMIMKSDTPMYYQDVIYMVTRLLTMLIPQMMEKMEHTNQNINASCVKYVVKLS